jgi:hypothetical protein
MRKGALAMLFLAAAACNRPAPSYAPPPQRPVYDDPDPGHYLQFVKMASGFANEHIVRDVDQNPSEWRWAFAAPQFRFAVPKAAPFHFTADLAVAEETFKVTGPVTVTCTIDGRRIGAAVCRAPGRQTVTYKVPPKWLEPGSTATVDLVADKLWIAPTDGAKLSFLVVAAGFVE